MRCTNVMYYYVGRFLLIFHTISDGKRFVVTQREHTRVCAPTHTHRYPPPHTHTTQTHTYACTHTLTRTHTDTHTDRQTDRQTHTHTCTHTLRQTQTHTYLHTHTHIYTHTHTQRHTQRHTHTHTGGRCVTVTDRARCRSRAGATVSPPRSRTRSGRQGNLQHTPHSAR